MAIIETRKQLAARLHASERSILEMTKRGEIPALRLSKRMVRYDVDRVMEAINKQSGVAAFKGDAGDTTQDGA